ncbi:MAG: hypothetical protein ACE361_09060 [Aureliella sp.]
MKTKVFSFEEQGYGFRVSRFGRMFGGNNNFKSVLLTKAPQVILELNSKVTQFDQSRKALRLVNYP